MTVPTTIKLPEKLRERIASMAHQSGESMHAFMLRALEEQTLRAEQRQAFVESARESRAEFSKTSEYYEPGEALEYLRARASGQKASRPRSKQWRG